MEYNYSNFRMKLIAQKIAVFRKINYLTGDSMKEQVIWAATIIKRVDTAVFQNSRQVLMELF